MQTTQWVLPELPYFWDTKPTDGEIDFPFVEDYDGKKNREKDECIPSIVSKKQLGVNSET